MVYGDSFVTGNNLYYFFTEVGNTLNLLTVTFRTRIDDFHE